MLEQLKAWVNLKIGGPDRARRLHKCYWRYERDGGGGRMVSPAAMTEAAAVAWISQVLNVEVFYVDFERRTIFYRSLGVRHAD